MNAEILKDKIKHIFADAENELHHAKKEIRLHSIEYWRGKKVACKQILDEIDKIMVIEQCSQSI